MYIHSNESAFSTLYANEVLDLLKNENLSTKWDGDYSTIPSSQGVWAFLVDTSEFNNKLQLLCLSEIDEHMRNLQPVKNLVYLGFSENIRSDIDKELNLRGDAEFLRTLGATLGLLPVAGQSRYDSNLFKFSEPDMQVLNSFIKSYFKLFWLEIDTKNIEIELLRKSRPVFNIIANPYPCNIVRKSVKLCRNIASEMPNSEFYPILNSLKMEYLDIERPLFTAYVDFTKMEASFTLYGSEFPAKALDYLSYSRIKSIVADSRLIKWKEDYGHLSADSRTWNIELHTEKSSIISFGSKNTLEIQDKVKALNSIAFIITQRYFYW